MGCFAGKDPISDFENKNLLFVDICPSFEFLKKYSEIANQITILDHHKSSENMYTSNKDEIDKLQKIKIIMDMKLCGCELTWKYFFGDRVKPWFIEYVADRDLWKWELPNSKEVSAAIHYKKYINGAELGRMDILQNLNRIEIKELIEIGTTIIDIENKQLNGQLSRSTEGVFVVDDKEYQVVFGTVNYDMRSEFGNRMATKCLSNGKLPDFGVVWNYDSLTDSWYISLRGLDNSPDLSSISKYFGGGGHSKAAGFETKKNPFGNIFLVNR